MRTRLFSAFALMTAAMLAACSSSETTASGAPLALRSATQPGSSPEPPAPELASTLIPASEAAKDHWPGSDTVWLMIWASPHATGQLAALSLDCLEAASSCATQLVRIGQPFPAENMGPPVPAPDGAGILFSPDLNGILLLRPSGEVKPLTPKGVIAFEPAWAPDGRRVLYTVSLPTGRYEQWITNADGGEAIRLAEGIGGTWSPDGASILYRTLGDTQLMRIPVEGGEPQPVLPGLGGVGSVAWSPDGRQIALSRYDGVRASLYVVEVNGSGSRELTPELHAVNAIAWSPDGLRLAFTDNRSNTSPPDIYVINSDGTGLMNITDTPNGVEESPVWLDDSRLAFIRDSRDLWMVNADGSGLTPLTRLNDGEQVAAFNIAR